MFLRRLNNICGDKCNCIVFSLNRNLASFSGDSHSTVDLAHTVYKNNNTKDDKTPIIILHGFLGSKGNWNSMSKAINVQTQRKVIAVDARNHGDSPHAEEHNYNVMTADLVQLIEKLETPKVNLIGHSMGGRTAMLMAILHPELVSSLIIEDICPVWTTPNIHLLNGFLDTMEAVEIPQGMSIAEARKTAGQQLSSIQDKAIRSFLLTNLTQTNKETHWRINLKVLKSSFTSGIATFTIDRFNKQYNGPTLFIGGSKSNYLRKEDFHAIKDIFPKADLTYIESGHWVHSEKPAEFIKTVVSFLEAA